MAWYGVAFVAFCNRIASKCLRIDNDSVEILIFERFEFSPQAVTYSIFGEARRQTAAIRILNGSEREPKRERKRE